MLEQIFLGFTGLCSGFIIAGGLDVNLVAAEILLDFYPVATLLVN